MVTAATSPEFVILLILFLIILPLALVDIGLISILRTYLLKPRKSAASTRDAPRNGNDPD